MHCIWTPGSYRREIAKEKQTNCSKLFKKKKEKEHDFVIEIALMDVKNMVM